MENAIPDTFSQSAIAHNIYLDSQEILKLLNQSCMPQQRRASLKLDQEIDVALRVGLSPGNGAEDPHIMGTMLGSNCQDLITP